MNEITFYKDNYLKTTADTSLYFNKPSGFIGKKIILEKYKELFHESNGYTIYNEEYDEKSIHCNINITIDNDGYLESISTYKIKSGNSSVWGRPHGDKNLSFNKNDFEEMFKILDEITEDYTEQEYQQLCDSFINKEKLSNGFTFNKCESNGIRLITPEGKTTLVAKKDLLFILSISHQYIDVLYSEETLKSCKYIKEEKIPSFLAILSKVNFNHYHNIAKLKFEALKRELLRQDCVQKYQKLQKAAASNDTQQIQKLIDFAIVALENKSLPPIIYSIKNNNLKMLKLLLENGASTINRFEDPETNKEYFPLSYALENSSYEFINILLEHNATKAYREKIWSDKYHDNVIDIYDYLLKIIQGKDLKLWLSVVLAIGKSNNNFCLTSKFIPNLDKGTIKSLITNNINVKWSLNIIKKYYKKDNKLCKSMLTLGAEEDVAKYFFQEEDFEMFTRCIDNYPRFTIDEKDTNNHKFYLQLVNCDFKWYQSAILCKKSPFFNFESYCLSTLLSEGNYQKILELKRNGALNTCLEKEQAKSIDKDLEKGNKEAYKLLEYLITQETIQGLEELSFKYASPDLYQKYLSTRPRYWTSYFGNNDVKFLRIIPKHIKNLEILFKYEISDKSYLSEYQHICNIIIGILYEIRWLATNDKKQETENLENHLIFAMKKLLEIFPYDLILRSVCLFHRCNNLYEFAKRETSNPEILQLLQSADQSNSKS